MTDSQLVVKMKSAIEQAQGGIAQYLCAIPIHEKRGGSTLWYGKVYVFCLQQSARWSVAYAWFNITSTDQRHFIELHGSIDENPSAAIKFTLVTGAWVQAFL